MERPNFYLKNMVFSLIFKKIDIDVDQALKKFIPVNDHDYKILEINEPQNISSVDEYSRDETPIMILQYRDTHIVHISSVSIIIYDMKSHQNCVNISYTLNHVYKIVIDSLNRLKYFEIKIDIKFMGLNCEVYASTPKPPLELDGVKKLFATYINPIYLQNVYSTSFNFSEIISNSLFFNYGLEIYRNWSKKDKNYSENNIIEQGVLLTLELNDRYKYDNSQINVDKISFDNEKIFSLIARSRTKFNKGIVEILSAIYGNDVIRKFKSKQGERGITPVVITNNINIPKTEIGSINEYKKVVVLNNKMNSDASLYGEAKTEDPEMDNIIDFLNKEVPTNVASKEDSSESEVESPKKSILNNIKSIFSKKK